MTRDELFSRISTLSHVLRLVRAGDELGVRRAQYEIRDLRLEVSELPVVGGSMLPATTFDVHKIVLDAPLHEGLVEDWKALAGTLRQKGLNWL